MMSDLKLQPSAAQNAYVRICAACSQAFEPARTWQRFCAPRCRASEHRRIRSQATSTRSVGVVAFSSDGGGYIDDFEHFAVSVSHRLQKGEKTYQGRSFSAEPHALIEEIRDELRDVAGWAFLLDYRLARMAQEVAGLERALPEEKRGELHHDQGAAPNVQHDGGVDHPLGMPDRDQTKAFEIGEEPAHESPTPPPRSEYP